MCTDALCLLVLGIDKPQRVQRYQFTSSLSGGLRPVIIRSGAVPKDISVPTNAEHSVIRGRVTAKLRGGLVQVVGGEGEKRNISGAQLAVRRIVVEPGHRFLTQRTHSNPSTVLGTAAVGHRREPPSEVLAGAHLGQECYRYAATQESQPNASAGAHGDGRSSSVLRRVAN